MIECGRCARPMPEPEVPGSVCQRCGDKLASQGTDDLPEKHLRKDAMSRPDDLSAEARMMVDTYWRDRAREAERDLAKCRDALAWYVAHPERGGAA